MPPSCAINSSLRHGGARRSNAPGRSCQANTSDAGRPILTLRVNVVTLIVEKPDRFAFAAFRGNPSVPVPPLVMKLLKRPERLVAGGRMIDDRVRITLAQDNAGGLQDLRGCSPGRVQKGIGQS